MKSKCYKTAQDSGIRLKLRHFKWLKNWKKKTAPYFSPWTIYPTSWKSLNLNLSIPWRKIRKWKFYWPRSINKSKIKDRKAIHKGTTLMINSNFLVMKYKGLTTCLKRSRDISLILVVSCKRYEGNKTNIKMKSSNYIEHFCKQKRLYRHFKLRKNKTNTCCQQNNSKSSFWIHKSVICSEISV